MKRNHLIQLSLGLFVAGFVLTGSTGLLIINLIHGDDSVSHAKATQPVTIRPPTPKPTEVVKATVPKTLPRATEPTPKATGPATKSTMPEPVEIPPPPANGDKPSDAYMRHLVIMTLLDLDAAKKKKDIGEFNAKMAASRQNEDGKRDAQGLANCFTVSLASLKDAVPVFAPAPALGGENVLSLKGYIPGKFIRVDFDFGFVFEQGAWKLRDIGRIGWQQTAAGPIP
jgi:hypothetical protein